MTYPAPSPSLEATPEGPLRIPLQGDGAAVASANPQGGGQTSTLALSLVIPTFNEGQNLAPLVARLTRLLDPMLPNDYELIVVDDDSPDRTWEQALTLGQTLPQLRVLRRCHERGLSSAVIRGWQVARGRILGVIDADLQHPPEVILPLWQGMQAGADLAVGSRHVDGGGVSQWSLTRRMLSRGAQTLGLLVLPQVVGRVSDPMSGFFYGAAGCDRWSYPQPQGLQNSVGSDCSGHHYHHQRSGLCVFRSGSKVPAKSPGGNTPTTFITSSA